MIEFLSVVNHLDLKVFLIDPIINYQLIGESDRKLLIDKQFITRTNLIVLDEDQEYCVSFGVLAEYLPDLRVSEPFYLQFSSDFYSIQCRIS